MLDLFSEEKIASANQAKRISSFWQAASRIIFHQFTCKIFIVSWNLALEFLLQLPSLLLQFAKIIQYSPHCWTWYREEFFLRWMKPRLVFDIKIIKYITVNKFYYLTSITFIQIQVQISWNKIKASKKYKKQITSCQNLLLLKHYSKLFFVALKDKQ